MQTDHAVAERLADQWLSQYSLDEIVATLSSNADFSVYQDDPVGFIREKMGITLTDDIEKLAESVRDNQITIARSATGTGKSHGASALAIWFFTCLPDSRVYTIANPYENQKILWSEISQMADRTGLLKNCKIKTMEIIRSAKDFIQALTVPTTDTEEAKEGKFSGKHHRHMMFIVDEADTVPEFVYRGVDGCMSGGEVVRLLLLFNPRSKLGYPWQLERDNLANVLELSAFNHPNVITGKNIIPGGPVDCEKTVRRINKWCRPLVESEVPDDQCFELPPFLEYVSAEFEGQKGRFYEPLEPGWYRVKPECPWFWYMVLGKYPPSAPDQLIPEDAITKARSRWDAYVAVYGEKPPEGSSAIMGQDVAEFGVDKNVSCFRYGGWVDRFLEWANVNTTETAEKAAKEYKARRVSICHVDATGVGSGVAPLMIRHGCLAASVKVASRPTRTTELGDFHILRDQLWWQVREWLINDPWSMIPPDEELIQELMVPTYVIKNGRVHIMPKDDMKEHLGRSPNKADALCLTFAEGIVSQPRAVVDPGTREKHKQKARVLGV